ncbi:MAG: pyridoxal phosphate-dependent aminotransferase family protein [bacterium]|nr:pyridoxal phosphate-dependent aminotransferase family protein [bacterium]MBU1918070.1 pyridoxal phosphate-dependent aminotransferase family protein [bacterium]
MIPRILTSWLAQPLTPTQHAPPLESAHLILNGPVGRHTRFSDHEVTFYGGTNYLGLANHPLTRMAAGYAALKYGTSVAASRITTGTAKPHIMLERSLALYMGTKDAVICGSGGDANRILLNGITNFNDVVFCEQTAHPTLLESVPKNIRTQFFSQDDLTDLEHQLQGIDHGLILINGVNALTGRIAPLDQLYQLMRQRPGLRLVVDDCHGVFVLGLRGKGTVEHFGIRSDQVFQTGTMSKALGSFGGFIAGSKELCQQLRDTTTYRASTPLPPPVAAASIASIALLLSRGSDLRRALLHNAKYLATRLNDLGFETTFYGTPILSIKPPQDVDAKKLSDDLLREGIYLPFIRYPHKDSPGQLRLALSAAHLQEDIDALCDQLVQACNRHREQSAAIQTI